LLIGWWVEVDGLRWGGLETWSISEPETSLSQALLEDHDVAYKSLEVESTIVLFVVLE
jgi:hypothetical protein